MAKIIIPTPDCGNSAVWGFYCVRIFELEIYCSAVRWSEYGYLEIWRWHRLDTRFLALAGV